MSDSADSAETYDLKEARARVEALESHVKPHSTHATERLSVVRTQLDEFEQAGTESDRQGALDKIESELETIRTAIEEEVEEGKSKAHGIVDDIEQQLSKLR